MPEPGSNDPTIPPSQVPTASVPDHVPKTVRGFAHLAPGTVISRYRIESVLGEGGMGAVYLARQEKPARDVALKVIRPGYATERMLKRFELEAEVLGRLLHPGIAQIYEAGVWIVEPPTGAGGWNNPSRPMNPSASAGGSTVGGWNDLSRPMNPPTSVGGSTRMPFFAMELVKGVPLTRYAEEKKLGTRERLELIAKVCDAVQHAHQKGVIHRDLKPFNILVTEIDAPGESTQHTTHSTHPGAGRGTQDSARRTFTAQPKILDFGVARATDSDLQQTTMETDVGAIIGTIPYMSPEQVGGDPAELDTRSDVYALGVIAYELLVGRLPYDLERKMIHEAARIIREEEPTRLSSIDRTLRGDVETIVGHALEKDKARRYGAASALAADIRRYLNDEPIAARPASTWYQVVKFSRRNKGLVVGFAAAFLVLVAGLIVSLYAFERAKAERDEKARALENVTRVAEFYGDMLSQIDPNEAGRLLEDDLITRLTSALKSAGLGDAEQAAELDRVRGGLQRVNRRDAALALIDRTIMSPAVEAIDQRFKDQPVVDAQLRQVLGDRYRELGLLERAMPLHRSALATRRRVLGEEHPETLSSINHLGMLLLEMGRLEVAETYLREAIEKSRRVLGEDHAETLKEINNLGMLLHQQGRLEEALSYYREALDKKRRVRGPDHPDTLNSLGNMGMLLMDAGKLDEAEPYTRETLERSRAVLGNDHPSTLTSINNMGSLLQSQGKLAEAEPYYREAMEKSRRVLGEEHPDTIGSIHQLGLLLQQQGRLDEAQPLVLEAVEKCRHVLGPEHPGTLASSLGLANLLRERGDHTESERILLSTQSTAESVLPGRHEVRIAAIRMLVEHYQWRDTAEPGMGYDAKAAEWKAKLDAISTRADPSAAGTTSKEPN